MSVTLGEVLWEPGEAFKRGTRLAAFMSWLRAERGLHFDDYESLWQWSVSDLRAFWTSVWQFFDIQADGDPSVVLCAEEMPGARWFPDARSAPVSRQPAARSKTAGPRSTPAIRRSFSGSWKADGAQLPPGADR